MANTVTISQSTFNDMLSRISKLEKALSYLLKKYEKEPSYGSDVWWEREMKLGEEDIKNGRYTSISTKEELDTFFRSL